jgi:Cytochrome c oxidase subunit III.
MSQNTNNYYLPAPSLWPLIASIALFMMAGGLAMDMNDIASGNYVLIAGALVFIYLLFGWFKEVITESLSGFYNKQVDSSFRWAWAGSSSQRSCSLLVSSVRFSTSVHLH